MSAWEPITTLFGDQASGDRARHHPDRAACLELRESPDEKGDDQDERDKRLATTELQRDEHQLHSDAPVLITDGQILRGGTCGGRCHFARVGLWLQLDSRPARHARLATARLITDALV